VERFVVPLWDGPAPHALGDRAEDRPFVEVFRPDPAAATGSVMLIFPGGAYTFLSPRSGEQYGVWLAEAGITGIVVNFRLGSNGYRYPALLADARRAFAVVRSHATAWDVDPERTGVIGTSAGGHLASLLVTGAACESAGDRSYGDARPALGVLCYSVISLRDPLAHHETRRNFLGDLEHRVDVQEQFSGHLRVTASTPPCFIWHTNTDEEVSAENSRLFAEAMRELDRPYELHLYASGAHALGLARDHGLFWSDDCVRWLRGHGF
jgi:acetyl esterase/lipase